MAHCSIIRGWRNFWKFIHEGLYRKSSLYSVIFPVRRHIFYDRDFGIHMLQKGPPNVEEENIPAGVLSDSNRDTGHSEGTVFSATGLRVIDVTFFARQSI